MRFASTAPPKTPPSSIMVDKRESMIPPPAPLRAGHHLGDNNLPPSPSFPLPSIEVLGPSARRASQSNIVAPAFTSRHMPTFSEPSILYSPLPPSSDVCGRSPAPQFDALPPRSSTPIRRSLTFTPTSASMASQSDSMQRRPPSIMIFDRSETPTKASLRYGTNMDIDTPPAFLRRNIDPSRSSSPSAHRSRRVRVDSNDSVLRFQFPKSQNVTPINPKFGGAAGSTPGETATPTQAQQPTMEPTMLVPPSRLEPALFPSSPFSNGSPPFSSPPPLHAPTSGVRLGVLCGSGSGIDEDDDIDMDMNVDAISVSGAANGFLPVYLDANPSSHASQW
jgi:hypothetical protein